MSAGVLQLSGKYCRTGWQYQQGYGHCHVSTAVLAGNVRKGMAIVRSVLQYLMVVSAGVWPCQVSTEALCDSVSRGKTIFRYVL